MDNSKALTLLLLLLVLLIVTSCKHKKNELSDTSSAEILVVDTSVIAIIAYDTMQYGFENCKHTKLINVDIDMIDLLMDGYLKVYNKTQEDKYSFYAGISPSEILDKNNFVIVLNRYKRQYIPMINDKGETIVWVNCFCLVPENFNWRKDILRADDGGNCFFNLLVNLTTKKCSDLRVNGHT